MILGRYDSKDQVINQIRVLRGAKKKPSPKRLPVWLHPIPVERDYNRTLQRYVSELALVILDIIPPLKDVVKERANMELDSVRTDDWADDAQRLLQTMALGFDKVALGIGNVARNIAGKTDVWNNRQWRKIMKAGLGVELFAREPWLVPMTNSFVAENTDLVTKMTLDLKANIGGTVQRGLRAGASHKNLAKEIRKNIKVTRNRAKVIARDQVSKLNGDLTKTRQEQAGVEDYFWRDSDDERVRLTHKANDGKKFSWDKPPENTGKPGDDVQCRCYGEPDFSGILDEVEDRKIAA